jgi:hypothetical protein
MSINFNSVSPAAPANNTNVVFQIDGSDNVSAYVPTQPAPAVNTQTSTYVATISDAQNIVVMNVSSATTFTVPPNSSVDFPVGTVLTVIQYGTGQVTLTAGAGVTFYTPSSLTTRAQYSTVSLSQVSVDTWIAGGDLT